ncbi:zinc-dependent alcohol dehydrogenase family protein [Yeosuana marina]|uniref:zinc-dependent alcohol dehydrogenase family protein n=1 Tax=Yeosuana marina TaxID=1565536 RepID=UPI0014220377|nr:zinc-dependent alcohol dehydrogenase family protein [Yeosuana marina]
MKITEIFQIIKHYNINRLKKYTLRALYFREKGAAAKVLELGEKNIQDLSDNEVRIKVLASSINPADFMFIEKQYRVKPEFPQIAGFEGAGTIIDNGGDENFPLNSIVAFRHKNIWAEFANIPKDKIILLPKNFPIEKAAQLSLNPLTAWALLEESNAHTNEWIVLSAASSTVSKLIIQFAKNKGINTIAIVRDFEQKEELLSLGANMVLISDNEIIEKQIRELGKTERIVSFLDAVGGDLASTIIKTISPGSKIIHYGLYSDQNVTYHNADIIFKNLTIQGFGIDGWQNNKSKTELKKIWTNIIHEIMNQDFKMEVSGKYSLKAFKQAIIESRNNKSGKILFWMN